jgi:hypothetical protein
MLGAASAGWQRERVVPGCVGKISKSGGPFFSLTLFTPMLVITNLSKIEHQSLINIYLTDKRQKT